MRRSLILALPVLVIALVGLQLYYSNADRGLEGGAEVVIRSAMPVDPAPTVQDVPRSESDGAERASALGEPAQQSAQPASEVEELRFEKLRRMLSAPKYRRNLADTIVSKGLDVALSSELYLPLMKDHARDEVDQAELRERIAAMLPDIGPELTRTTELQKDRRKALDALTEARIKSGLAEVVDHQQGEVTVGSNRDPNRIEVSVLRGGKTYTVNIGDGDDPALDVANRELEASVEYLVSIVRSRLASSKH